MPARTPKRLGGDRTDAPFPRHESRSRDGPHLAGNVAAEIPTKINVPRIAETRRVARELEDLSPYPREKHIRRREQRHRKRHEERIEIPVVCAHLMPVGDHCFPHVPEQNGGHNYLADERNDAGQFHDSDSSSKLKEGISPAGTFCAARVYSFAKYSATAS